MALADDPVMPLAEALLHCLCGLLPETHRGDVCSCCVYPGQIVPTDYCCACGDDTDPREGQAFVRVGRMFPTSPRFPTPAAPLRETCVDTLWAVELVMGVYRCAATLDEHGRPPACADISDDAEALASDAAAMRAAALCCFPAAAHEPLMLIGEYQSVGPQGGCMGGTQQIIVQFEQCCPD